MPDDRDPEPPTAPVADATLGGYLAEHHRPPAYEGPDGYPYTVSIEVERTGDLRAPFAGYLVFPRWGRTGVGIVGHVESETLVEGSSEHEVRSELEGRTLVDVQRALVDAIGRSRGGDGGAA